MLLFFALTAFASDWEASALIGGEFNTDSHGILAAGLRSGPVSILYNTDTLSAVVEEEGERGRWWAQVKGQAGVAGMFPFPWTDGAKDPSMGLSAYTLGAEVGAVRYLGHGLYGGGWAGVHYWAFAPTNATFIAVPDGRPVLTSRAVVGYWSKPLTADVQGGFSIDAGELVPQLSAVVAVHTSGFFRPIAEIRAGVSSNVTPITATRLGGLNPYVVPLAGAAWAEFRVDDYAVARLGPGVASERWRAGLFADLAWFDGREAVGIGSLGSVSGGPWTVTVIGGVAPWLERPSGVAGTVYAAVEHEWRSLKRDSDQD
ncbi:MAG: hypothetical protein ACJATT_003809 [Myxococcota bacterium]|jgi:hypothetical protein